MRFPSPHKTKTHPPQLTHLNHLPTHIHTLFLFTKNDFPTFALPTTLFALLTTLSGHPLTTNTTPTLFPTLLRIPYTLTLIWLALLVINIANQRHPAAVAEDKTNNAHRPLPQGRMTCEDARKLLLVVVPVVVAVGWGRGVLEETLLVCALAWMYNDLGGSEHHWGLKNLIVSVGYGVFFSLALRITTGPNHTITAKGYHWIIVITLVMFATQHIADVKDVEGDRLRGRRTAPVALGEEVCRWSIAAGVVLSSGFCSAFFDLGVASHCFTVTLGCLVAGRTIVCRGVNVDKTTWRLWVLWTCTLFSLPLVASPLVLFQAWEEVKAMVCVRGECNGVLNLGAASGIALIIKSRRVIARLERGNTTVVSVPEIAINGVVG